MQPPGRNQLRARFKQMSEEEFLALGPGNLTHDAREVYELEAIDRGLIAEEQPSETPPHLNECPLCRMFNRRTAQRCEYCGGQLPAVSDSDSGVATDTELSDETTISENDSAIADDQRGSFTCIVPDSTVSPTEPFYISASAMGLVIPSTREARITVFKARLRISVRNTAGEWVNSGDVDVGTFAGTEVSDLPAWRQLTFTIFRSLTIAGWFAVGFVVVGSLRSALGGRSPISSSALFSDVLALGTIPGGIAGAFALIAGLFRIRFGLHELRLVKTDGSALALGIRGVKRVEEVLDLLASAGVARGAQQPIKRSPPHLFGALGRNAVASAGSLTAYVLAVALITMPPRFAAVIYGIFPGGIAVSGQLSRFTDTMGFVGLEIRNNTPQPARISAVHVSLTTPSGNQITKEAAVDRTLEPTERFTLSLTLESTAFFYYGKERHLHVEVRNGDDVVARREITIPAETGRFPYPRTPTS